MAILIGILYYKFNSFDTNALQDHLVDTLSNGQFIDVSGRSRSPYFTNTVFLASHTSADMQNRLSGVGVSVIIKQGSISCKDLS